MPEGIVPISILDNAIGVFGDADTTGTSRSESSHVYHRPYTVTTNGDGQTLAGNIVGIVGYVPMAVNGNAVAAGSTAKTNSHTTQYVEGAGDFTTSGQDGVANGTIAVIRQSFPVGFINNGVAAAGNASTDGSSTQEGHINGGLASDGSRGAVSGSILDFSHAHPVGLNNSAYSLGGNSTTHSHDTGIATVGEDVTTQGQNGVLSGTVAQPTLALPCELCGDAVTVAGNSTSSGSKTKLSTASPGPITTGGDNSTASGLVAQAPVSLPHGLTSTSAAGLGGASAEYDETNTMVSGGPVNTTGEKSTLGGNVVSTPVLLLAEAFANAVSVGGTSYANADSDQTIIAGGPITTKGTDSVGGGNIVEAPIIAAANIVGHAVAAGGTAHAESPSSVKYAQAGGDAIAGTPDGEPTGSTAASNVVQLPAILTILPADNAVSGLGFATSDGRQQIDMIAGGDSVTNGNAGSLSGNIAEGAFSQPIQAAGIAATSGGIADAKHTGYLNHQAGGEHVTDGTNGSLSGNIVPVAWAGAAEAFGDAIAAPGIADAIACVSTTSVAGGDSTTSGDSGSGSGNIVRADAVPVAQVFGVAGALVGNADAHGDNRLFATAGGDTATSGYDSSVSGNDLGASVPAILQVMGDAVAVAGNATGTGGNITEYAAGGQHTTSGGDGLSGRMVDVPVAVLGLVYNVPIELLGNAGTNMSPNSTTSVDGKSVPLALPVNGALLGANEVPTYTCPCDEPWSDDERAGISSMSGVLPYAV